MSIIKAKLNINRLCIFAHYDKHNIVDDYVVEYIKGLSTVSKQIIFVSSCEISYAEVDKISKYCTAVLQKANEGYDFGSWKFGMEYIGFDNLPNFDEVILANDSCFGPIFPLSEMFDKMATKECDVWSVTIGISIAEYLQSYFLVCRPRLLKSQQFINFFKSITNLANKMEYIIKYEIGFSKMLKNNNFIFDSYYQSRTKNIDNSNNNILFAIRVLLSKIFFTIQTFVKPTALGRPNLFKKLIVFIKMILNILVFRKIDIAINPSIFEYKFLIEDRIPLTKKMLFDEDSLSQHMPQLTVKQVLDQNVEQLIKENSDYSFDIIEKYNDRVLK